MPQKKPTILIVDDEGPTRDGLRRALARDYTVAVAESADVGLVKARARSFDVVLTDLRMPGMDGIHFIRELRALAGPPECVMMTAYGTIDNAVEATKAGAHHVLEKPVKLDQLELVLADALKARVAPAPVGVASTVMIGSAPATVEVFDTLKQIAPARSTVLITGESGTGKELAARTLHELSGRAQKPFVAVHCAALVTTLLTSELFGHEKGAFTGADSRRIGRFEAAHGGTVFLDEIGEIDSAVQITLLRFLETRAFERVGGSDTINVDVRLIAATNQDLKKRVSDGTFREDLYFRLNVIQVRMPPLRERREDIPLLLNHFLEVVCHENNSTVGGFAPAALALLQTYAWPGNIRELRNIVERMVVLSKHNELTVDDVPEEIVAAVGDTGAGDGSDPLDIGSHEKQLIVQALKECKGNKTEAAKKLGISRRTLHRKVNEYGLREE